MSSSIGEDSVCEGKLLIHIAENGHSFELECDGTTLVDSVMRFVASVSGIQINDQLVLCLDMKLEPQRPLSAYKLPCDDREVFIFNKLRIQTNSPPPPPEEVTVLEITDPPLPSPSSDPHPLDDAPDPALKALPSYERQFRYHFQCGNSIYSRTQATYDNCERLLVELKVQERAVEVARSNLEQYYRMINQNYTEFMKRYLQQNRLHSDLLANFGRDLDRLRSVRIHPALQTGTRKCLLDFLKEEDLRRAADNCGSSHRQFENKVSQFKQMFGEVKQKVEELFASKASLPVRNLDRAIKEHQRFINEQRSIMQSLSKDVNTVKKLVDDCLSHQVSSSLRPHDAVSALGPMYDVHDKNHLPKMLSCDQTISKLLEFCKDKKNEMNVFIHSYVQRITYLSYIIKDVKLQFPVFREAMMRQDDLFVDLKVVRGIGPAYRACLAEVARRKSSMKLYMGMAGQLAEKLATKREAEVRRREEFLKTQSSYLPRDVLALMGLFDMPNQCDVNIAPFDTELLDINVSDIDRFAPEFTCKGDRHGSLKNSVSMSHESEDFPEDDVLDGSELVEIAGTGRTEVENAKLRADLASAIAQICLLRQELEYESLDDSNRDILLKDAAEKTTQALHQKDEYVKHLESMMKKMKSQCSSYEERIQELEQKLSDEYSQEQKLSSIKNASESATKVEQTESMDEVSCISNSLNSKLAISKAREGGDENMMDSSGLAQPQLDSSMVEMQHASKDKAQQLETSLTNSSTAESMNEALNNVLSSGTGERMNLPSKVETDLVLELKSSLEERSNQLNELEDKYKAAMEEQVTLKREVEARQKLLDESQMNCAHLENCLHEAREEAQTNLCAAERRAQEYSSLRASAVKMRGLFERLRTCVYSPGGVAGFADSLRSLAQSLSNSLNEKDDDGTVEFRKCIVVLADKVGFLSRHRQEILQKYPELEAANEQMKKELEEKEELVKTLYKKLQLEKQANKEKISFGRLEVHERAAFVLNPSDHYEAINRSCHNYYLSSESIALFTDHLPTRPAYIVGQIVHIERQISTRDPVAPNGSTPYNVPAGSEFFIVTVAMLPDTAIHSSSSLLLSS